MLETGQLIPLSFLGRDFTVVVIDPDGLGPGRRGQGKRKKKVAKVWLLARS